MERIPRTATNVITAVTALAWLVAWGTNQLDRAAWALGLVPARFSGFQLPFPVAPALLTPLTSTLVHASWYHVGFNLIILVYCGIQVERVIGAGGFIVLYVAGAYAAAGAELVASPHYAEPIVGASGAISAVIGAFALSFGRARAFTNNLRVNRWINVAWLMVAWVVLQMMMGWLGNQQGFLLATPAHVGGFAAGLLLQRPLLLWRYRHA